MYLTVLMLAVFGGLSPLLIVYTDSLLSYVSGNFWVHWLILIGVTWAKIGSERICLCFCNSWKMHPPGSASALLCGFHERPRLSFPARGWPQAVSRWQSCHGHLPSGSSASPSAHPSGSSPDPFLIALLLVQVWFLFCFFVFCFWGVGSLKISLTSCETSSFLKCMTFPELSCSAVGMF